MRIILLLKYRTISISPHIQSSPTEKTDHLVLFILTIGATILVNYKADIWN